MSIDLMVDSTLHPDTGEPILLPFRMSCFVPTNMVLVLGMLTPNPTIKTTIFWQWANQSVNVAFNSANANKSTPMNWSETAVAYVSAVTTSCAIAVGLNQAVPRLNIAASTKRMLMKLVPFTAVAAAGTVNVFLMRGKEITQGIDVYDENDECVGKSKKAGLAAVSQVALSRILTNAPTLVVPPLIMDHLAQKPFFQTNPKALLPLNVGLIALSMFTSLPLAIATFPQISSLDTSSMEKEFQNLKDDNGKPISRLYYNKGL
ncbi:Tricarboxylate/iron carrier [Zychaea mexicana]|uniref:Tricarboxylate/iron carrier n=1 Tax=Zychaea mexicana TaxID=64656 RepID=UPI0022FF27A6|nr:Tricarboxylate/iron carrier [Zychaea mexicana]KAI9489683.1 Tricarboxylate/iron carrier [Zychaea mexicana]